MLYKCLPEEDLKPVMRLRWFLDYLAAFQTLVLKRHVGDFKAVFRARRDYKRWRKDFEKDRQQIQKSRVGKDIEYAPFLLLWKYYVKGCKTYSQLR